MFEPARTLCRQAPQQQITQLTQLLNELEAVMRRAHQAESAGRRFSTYHQQLCWGETEVMLFLRNRSRVLQFALPDVVERLGRATKIYDFERTDA